VTLTLIGIAVGLGAAFAITHFVSGLLYEVGASDPPTFGGAALLFLLVATCASIIPARRAMQIDPMVALRDA
jgi:ABC-type antimicrobial peptide transport system permease subunit